MKHKNSWDMTEKESLFNKKERIERVRKYREMFPDEDPNTFRCICGLRHKWSELGRKHTCSNAREKLVNASVSKS